MARLYADEQMPAQIVHCLRRPWGHDVPTVQKTNTSKYGDGKEDELILEIATKERRAVLTLNRKHFRALHETVSNHYGIRACIRSDDPKHDADVIDSEIKRVLRESGSLRGQYVVVDCRRHES